MQGVIYCAEDSNKLQAAVQSASSPSPNRKFLMREFERLIYNKLPILQTRDSDRIRNSDLHTP